MTEQKVKKRGWVKNAAIIFLAVMLVLTFFSNTIMNHSLPEVAAQYVQSGAINAKIRGTGPVTAMESYEVKSAQTREVLSVPVQVGDTVKVGDTLILFSDAESTQLKEAEAALDALVLTYQKGLLNANSVDYAKENRDIKLAQQALDKAKADRDANAYSASDYASAKANVNRAKNEITIQQAKVDSLQNQLGGMTQPGDNSSTYAQIQKKQAEITAAQKDINTAKLAFSVPYKQLEDYAKDWKTVAKDTVNDVSFYISALGEYFAKQVEAKTPPATIALPFASTIAAPSLADATSMADAYSTINAYNVKIASLNSDILALQGQVTGGDWNYNTVKNQLAEAKAQLVALQTVQTNFEAFLKDLEEKKTKFDTAVTAVETNQVKLEDMMFALAEKQKTDGKTAASSNLDLAAQRKQINDKKEDLAKLQKGGEGSSVVSKVNGKISTISVSAGKTTTADTALMIIEVPDMGYGVSFSVTTEQSKKVAIGDAAEISNFYSNEALTATLIGIKSDPKNPGTNKILNFKLQGEVESGISLSLSIGERGGSYDTIVPNSAIRSDNNGKFVLAVIAKNSPLGNRFIAQRIDVKVITSDDVNTAVSGGLSSSDMVITTSTKPVEPGTQVRLPD